VLEPRWIRAGIIVEEGNDLSGRMAPTAVSGRRTAVRFPVLNDQPDVRRPHRLVKCFISVGDEDYLVGLASLRREGF
jgi:hypothetical protein